MTTGPAEQPRTSERLMSITGASPRTAQSVSLTSWPTEAARAQAGVPDLTNTTTNEPESRFVSARLLDRVTWAARYSEPLRSMPPASVRTALRRAAGVPRHVVAAAIGAAYTPFVQFEQDRVKRSRLADDLAYRRVLGYFANLLRERDPEGFDALMAWENEGTTDAEA